MRDDDAGSSNGEVPAKDLPTPAPPPAMCSTCWGSGLVHVPGTRNNLATCGACDGARVR